MAPRQEGAPAVVIDWTVNVTNLLALVAFIFAVAVFYSRHESMREDLGDIKKDIKTLNTAVIEIAIQKKDIESLNTRVNKLDDRFDELRRGEGLIVHAEQRR